MKPLFSGSGPGPKSRDGCSVELYRELPYLGELDDVIDLVPAGASVLELGCGPGRLTRILIGQGAVVTAVDNSPEMLAGLPAGATPVLSDIEALALGARFDVVLLASNMVNHPDRAVRRAFLDAACRHLRHGGRFLAERMDPAWLRDAAVGPVPADGDAHCEVEAVARAGDQVAMTVRYDRGMRCWRHSFVVEMLDDGQVERALTEAGFDRFDWFGARRRWIAARPVDAGM